MQDVPQMPTAEPTPVVTQIPATEPTPMVSQTPEAVSQVDLDKVLEKELEQIPSTNGKFFGKFSMRTIIIIAASILVLGGAAASAYYFMTKAPTIADTNATPPTMPNPFATKDGTEPSILDNASTDSTATEDNSTPDDTTPTVTPDDTTATPDSPPSLTIPSNIPTNGPSDAAANDLQNQVDTLKETADSAANVTDQPTITDESTAVKRVPRGQ